MGPEIANLIAGKADADIDVWALFQRDAHGLTGLFPGQLVTELLESRAPLLPRLVDAIRRGLTSADPREQRAALTGGAALPAGVDLTRELAILIDAHPAMGATRELIDLTTRQPVSSAAPLVARIAPLATTGPAAVAQARLLVAHRVADVRARLRAALARELTTTELQGEAAFLRALSPNDVDALAESLATEPLEVKARASRYLYEVLEAAKEPARYDRWMALHTRLRLGLDGVPARPYESPEAAERRRLLAERLTTMKAVAPAAPTTAPASVVLAAQVWLDALRIPEGPPVELFDQLRRHQVKVLRSAGLLDEVTGALRQLGWSAKAIAAARDRVDAATVAAGVSGDASAVARAAGLDTVYTVGPETGRQRDGVTLRPVHELLSLLQRVPTT